MLIKEIWKAKTGKYGKYRGKNILDKNIRERIHRFI